MSHSEGPNALPAGALGQRVLEKCRAGRQEPLSVRRSPATARKRRRKGLCQLGEGGCVSRACMAGARSPRRSRLGRALFIDIIVIVGGQHRDRRDTEVEGTNFPYGPTNARTPRHHHSSVEGLNPSHRVGSAGARVRAYAGPSGGLRDGLDHSLRGVVCDLGGGGAEPGTPASEITVVSGLRT